MNSAPGRLRIGHVIFRLDVGGLENGLVNLINGLSPGRFQHSVVCIDRSTDFRRRIKHDDVRIEEIRRKPGRDPGAAWRIFKVLRDIQPHIVHTRNLPALDALLPAFAAGVRIRIHGEHGRNVDDPLGKNAKHRLLRRLHAPLVSRFIALSNETRDYLIDGVGVRADRIDQIYNGVDVTRFTPASDRVAARRDAGVPFAADDFVFGFVGRLDPVKNPMLLIDAFTDLLANATSSGRQPKLAIIGDGPMFDDLSRAIAEKGIDKQCWLAGARNDIPEIMRGFDVFVLPSLVEGVSNTILEAMASGVPVVATNVGGNAELIDVPYCGYVVESESSDAISRSMSKYLEDRSLCLKHAEHARGRAVARFSLDAMIDSYRELYESMYDARFSKPQSRRN